MIRRFCLLLLWSWAAVFAGAAEPANLEPVKAALRAYVDSGEYGRDLGGVAAEAREWVEARAAARKPGERLAIVFDLDETLLSNLPHMLHQDFGYVPAAWDEWVESAAAPVLPAVQAVYLAARRLGVEVFYLTGRREQGRAGTERNLRAVACADYAALLMKPNELQGPTAAFKLAERRRIEAEGRVIIANVGDQQSDLEGGAAERTFKLPCPFYLTK